MGGRRKGFHLAVVTAHLDVQLARASTPAEAAEWLSANAPSCIGIDSPAAWAPAGQSSRPCERAFAAAGICGIRFTPDEETARAHEGTYYEWIEHGRQLWAELRTAGAPLIECFPTASWTQWCGRRRLSRARWTKAGLEQLCQSLGTELGRPRNQDERDAVAAALTARQADLRPASVIRFGELVVPGAGSFG